MLQLSLVGPPVSPEPARSRHRLAERIRATMLDELAGCDIAAELVRSCTQAVVDTVWPARTRLSNRALLIRMAGGQPKCWICGYAIDLTLAADAEGVFSIDHVVPRSQGGGSLGFTNLKPAHRLCNIVRGDATIKPKRRKKYDAFLSDLAGGASAP